MPLVISSNRAPAFVYYFRRFVYHSRVSRRPLSASPETARIMERVNRLGSATSPYLLQHKDKYVDWWEWSPEALAEAKQRDVPILLSVGYAACHWCHGLMPTGDSGLQR